MSEPISFCVFYYNTNVNHLNFIIAYMYNVCAILLHLIFSVIILGELPKAKKKYQIVCIFTSHSEYKWNTRKTVTTYTYKAIYTSF